MSRPKSPSEALRAYISKILVLTIIIQGFVGISFTVFIHFMKWESFLLSLAAPFILPTFLSIPLTLISRYHDTSWRKSIPEFDIKGQWKLNAKIQRVFTLTEESCDIKQNGVIKFDQDYRTAWVEHVNLRDEKGRDLGGWKTLAMDFSLDGRFIYAANEMVELEDVNAASYRSHGKSIEVMEVIERDKNQRPIKLKCTWANAVSVDSEGSNPYRKLYLGVTIEERESYG